MMTPEELRNTDLEPAYILCVYNNGFEITNYEEWERPAIGWTWGCPDPIREHKIQIPVKLCGQTHSLIVCWNNWYTPFQTGLCDATNDFNVRKIVQEYIASKLDITLEQMEKAVKEGQEVFRAFSKMCDDAEKARETIWREKKRKDEEEKHKAYLAEMTPEKRRRTLLEEKAFDELAKTPIFNAKLQKSVQFPYDEEYDNEFQQWVLDEVKFRADRMEEDKL